MEAKFIGDPRDPGSANNLPEFTQQFGVTFERDKWASVPAGSEGKFEGNSHFETRDGKAAPAAQADDGKETLPDLADRVAGMRDVEALNAELKTEKRSGGKSIIEARIRELEATPAE